jgi:tripartite ATP-independent transporter DctM subunit
MMSIPAVFVAALLTLTLASGIWIGFALMSVGLFSLEMFRDMRLDRFLAGDIWGTATAAELVTLPLFIFMGEILFFTRLSENLFNGLAPWTSRLPGRLLHVNVLGCTLFAAVSGSSAATTATVGRITLKELVDRGYDKNLAMGSLAGAGTLGFLIPPSIPMIVYGVLTNLSILELFIAGIIPGLILALGYMLYLAIATTLWPSLVPARGTTIPLGDRLKALLQLVPVVFLILIVIGSMYAGLASVTEAAAVGVLGALLVALVQGTLSWRSLRLALFGAVRTCSMIGLIIAGALFLSKAMARIGLPLEVAHFIEGLHLSPGMLIFFLLLVYLALGCILDGLSAIVMTLPVTFPLATHAGFDPIWFGVFLIVTVEMAQVTPPVGFNLFVIQALTGESIGRVARASIPFCIIMAAFTLLMTVFPEVVTFLPRTIK